MASDDAPAPLSPATRVWFTGEFTAPTEAQRIGLSATTRPVEEVSTFLAGEQPVKIVRPTNRKSVRLQVEAPVAAMVTLGKGTGEVSGSAPGPERQSSIGPDAEQRILALVGEHRPTIMFANSRRLTERLTARLKRTGRRAGRGRPAGQVPGRGDRRGRDLVRRPTGGGPHHGSISREQAIR
ncbi:hypothetical protein [Streptomyces sp. NBC_00996]|uniref:hypothetical protein n=1 Tax=Streptomyces sp. NBC_00996 TaxID=2903710 RepID=UPI003867F431|nr:hypothetical protein OG390_02710 [Streptomyces sp. NBC_00996]